MTDRGDFHSVVKNSYQRLNSADFGERSYELATVVRRFFFGRCEVDADARESSVLAICFLSYAPLGQRKELRGR